MATLDNYHLYSNSFKTYSISFNDYVKLKSSYIKSQFTKEIDDDGTERNIVKGTIRNKYYHLMRDAFGNYSYKEKTIDKLCLLLDLITMYDTDSTIPKISNGRSEIHKIKNKINESLSKNSPIKNKSYNYIKKCVGYELEDGNFVEIMIDGTYFVEIELDDSIFPPAIIKEFDLSIYRNSLIKMIVDENR